MNPVYFEFHPAFKSDMINCSSLCPYITRGNKKCKLIFFLRIFLKIFTVNLSLFKFNICFYFIHLILFLSIIIIIIINEHSN